MCLFVFGKEEIVQRKVQVKAQQQKVKNKREQKYNYSLKRKTMGAGCELKIEEVMCFTKVSPMGLPAQPPPPPDRPSPVVRKSISRNLWGSPAKGETDAILAAQQEKQKTYVKERFNIDLEEIDKLPISALIKSEGAKDLFLPNPRLQGVKRTFQVLKANKSISNVPKRKRDNLSSELEANGQKEKNVQHEKKEEPLQQEEEKDGK